MDRLVGQLDERGERVLSISEPGAHGYLFSFERTATKVAGDANP